MNRLNRAVRVAVSVLAVEGALRQFVGVAVYQVVVVATEVLHERHSFQVVQICQTMPLIASAVIRPSS